VALELLLEKLLTCTPQRQQRPVKRVGLGIQIDPHTREAFAFFGIPDISLFKAFNWGRVTEILEHAWLGRRDERQEDREVVVYIQGGSKFGRELVEEHLRREVFGLFEGRIEVCVRFDS
jgi:hypothetical protein